MVNIWNTQAHTYFDTTICKETLDKPRWANDLERTPRLPHILVDENFFESSYADFNLDPQAFSAALLSVRCATLQCLRGSYLFKVWAHFLRLVLHTFNPFDISQFYTIFTQEPNSRNYQLLEQRAEEEGTYHNGNVLLGTGSKPRYVSSQIISRYSYVS